MSYYIHQHKNWPNFKWDIEGLVNLLSETRNFQGRLIGRMEALGFNLKDEALLDTLTLDVIKSAEIEGEIFKPEQVRSSIALKLGIEYARITTSDRNVDGMVEMMIDATHNCNLPLSKERLFDWHAALFPTGRSGMYKIVVGDWRKGISGPMQVVSGAAGKEIIHFEAPNAEIVEKEMSQFINWFNEQQKTNLVLKAAIAHLWFVTIHPFQDGNGRIARALTDLLLARADNINQRYYSMSAEIHKERKQYYEVLEITQKGDMDITPWLEWFLNCLINSLKSTESILNRVHKKANFWQIHAETILNERQKKLLNRMLDGFDGKLTSSKWAKIAKCSKDTAIRDINDLLNKKVLVKEASRGRSTSYDLNTNL